MGRIARAVCVLSAIPGALLPASANASDSEVLMSRRWVQRARLEAKKRYSEQANLRAIHGQLLSSLRIRNLTGILTGWEARLRTPGELDSAVGNLADILSSDKPTQGDISSAWDAATLAQLNHDCEGEIGAEDLLDQQYADAFTWYRKGIMRNVDFPLRSQMSCVRNQGQRGLCTVFAATAALETLYH